MGAFGSNFPDFRAIWLGTTKPGLQNRYMYGAAHQNIQTFISNLGYLWLTKTSWIDPEPSEPSNSSQSGHTGANVASVCPNEHVMKGEHGRASNFRQLWEGIVSLLFVSRTKTRLLWTRVDLCYHCGPFPACVGIWSYFNTNLIFSNMWQHIRVLNLVDLNLVSI